jgi:hypothetical protein
VIEAEHGKECNGSIFCVDVVIAFAIGDEAFFVISGSAVNFGMPTGGRGMMGVFCSTVTHLSTCPRPTAELWLLKDMFVVDGMVALVLGGLVGLVSMPGVCWRPSPRHLST